MAVFTSFNILANNFLPLKVALAGIRGFKGFSQQFCSGLARVWLSKQHWQIVKARPFVGLLQMLGKLALFFVASLNSFAGSGWLAVSQLTGVVFN